MVLPYGYTYVYKYLFLINFELYKIYDIINGLYIMDYIKYLEIECIKKYRGFRALYGTMYCQVSHIPWEFA